MGQALTVAKLCERKLCRTLRSVFLGERKPTSQDLFAAEALVQKEKSVHIQHWIEVLDYISNIDFHGFIMDDREGRTMFTFFPSSTQHKEFKSGQVLNPPQFTAVTDRF